MKVSFLIPSKNRLSLLRQAVSSIIDQDEKEIEIIVVDNASVETYQSYVRELNDSRLVYCRQLRPVSVTENWQQALSMATGDYILMLGDDDALAPGFFSAVRQFLTKDGPDVIYLAAYHYCYPNVIPERPAGYFASVRNSEFLRDRRDPFELDATHARELAQSVLDFRHRFGLNAQHFLLKASFVRLFSGIGGIYQSPYPDTFAAVLAFARAESIVVVPKELVIIGISPKSFGAYYFSGRGDQGFRFLDNEQVAAEIRAALKSVILPGDGNNTNWLIAAETVRRTCPYDLGEVNYARYRALQINAVLRDAYLHDHRSLLDDLHRKVSGSEALLVQTLESALTAVMKSQPRLLPKLFDGMTAQLGQYEPALVSEFDIGKHANIIDAYRWLSKKPNVAFPGSPFRRLLSRHFNRNG